jgi:hypothetical protein
VGFDGHKVKASMTGEYPLPYNQQDLTPEILPPPVSFVPLTSIYNIPSLIWKSQHLSKLPPKTAIKGETLDCYAKGPYPILSG